MIAGGIFSPIFLEAFSLTFLAEWGDRSQLATIGLAASTNVVGRFGRVIVIHLTNKSEALCADRKLALEHRITRTNNK